MIEGIKNDRVDDCENSLLLNLKTDDFTKTDNLNLSGKQIDQGSQAISTVSIAGNELTNK
ncbi:3127_t:CDS:1, partial [Racocetra persica]